MFAYVHLHTHTPAHTLTGMYTAAYTRLRAHTHTPTYTVTSIIYQSMTDIRDCRAVVSLVVDATTSHHSMRSMQTGPETLNISEPL